MIDITRKDLEKHSLCKMVKRSKTYLFRVQKEKGKNGNN